VPRFLLLLAPEPGAGGNGSAAELGARTARFAAWVDTLRASGALCEGARLDPRAGRLLYGRGGEARVEVELAAPLRHFFVVDVRDWEAALALAERCPGAEPGAIDVHRLDEDTWLRTGGASP
jgi:hypothetical protein